MFFVLLCFVSLCNEPVTVDRIEINEVYEQQHTTIGLKTVCKTTLKFKQVILWRWNGKRFEVSQWTLWDDKMQVIGNRIYFVSGRFVSGKELIHTKSLFDRERRDQELLPDNKRLPYIRRMN